MVALNSTWIGGTLFFLLAIYSQIRNSNFKVLKSSPFQDSPRQFFKKKSQIFIDGSRK